MVLWNESGNAKGFTLTKIITKLLLFLGFFGIGPINI